MSLANTLAGEVSPYLVQHADNPVAWQPWGPDAFVIARATGKPILLSIGYSACHWCHVMAHESFEDAETAALMNDLFVNIKVDREERPDVDHLYMQALHALGEQGGWPLTMFLDADGRPFWGGTYFPRVARYGRPSFKDVLRSIATAYQARPADIAANGEAILNALGRTAGDARADLDLALLDRLAPQIRDVFDPVNGGLRGAPKFPNPPILETLWRAADRTGDESIRVPVILTLERLCRGGIFDHIGGGFARYSVDERWLVPHFEKMLYDNAQLLPLLALAARHTGADLFRDAAARTVGWLLNEMKTDSGAFAASQDADSLTHDGHAEEGAFYVWSPSEVALVLGARAGAFCRAHDITARGNFEGASIPNRLHVRELHETEARAYDADYAALRAHRMTRPAPHRDDKVLADWNGLMITGLVRAAVLLDKPEWIAAAEAAFAGVLDCLGGESNLGHAYRNGRVTKPGFATDQAALALAGIALYEATGAEHALNTAIALSHALWDRYRIDSGLLATTVATAQDLPLRLSPTADDATPNAHGIAAESFIRLSALTGDTLWLERADRLIDAASGAVLANPFAHAALLNALDLRLRRAELTLVASPDHPLAQAMASVPYPNRTLRHVRPAERDMPHVLVCTDGRCSLPLAEPTLVQAEIEKAVHKGRPLSGTRR